MLRLSRNTNNTLVQQADVGLVITLWIVIGCMPIQWCRETFSSVEIKFKTIYVSGHTRCHAFRPLYTARFWAVTDEKFHHERIMRISFIFHPNHMSYILQCEQFNDGLRPKATWFNVLTVSEILQLYLQLKCNLKCDQVPFQRKIRILSWHLLPKHDQENSFLSWDYWDD